ncbi:hypothetical protein EIN_167110 [Entamoeba invadens IP1]|uniref:Uncharacterized protein n=1 Tax=Entamoeba invadens IP1 TaxID=370355 RepID=A0A0A1TVK7_ENTIV|nr:hypothetical protein EIN_167110 [Entamoeba invadens IP1]ELP84436.1 hypothetical protein EIN_167110 [Entamoeba invadens IP1]|eukprot:XP_004183782.1 hypothetical protein EIN_167110 [Entamoeba invadens IP1]
MLLIFLILTHLCFGIDPKDAKMDDNVEIPEELLNKIIRFAKNTRALLQWFSFFQQDTENSPLFFKTDLPKLIGDLKENENQMNVFLEETETKKTIKKRGFLDWLRFLDRSYNLHELHKGYGKYILHLSENLAKVQRYQLFDENIQRQVLIDLMLDIKYYQEKLNLVTELAKYLLLERDGTVVRAKNRLLDFCNSLVSKQVPEIQLTPHFEEHLLPKITGETTRAPERPAPKTDLPSILIRGDSAKGLMVRSQRREAARRRRDSMSSGESSTEVLGAEAQPQASPTTEPPRPPSPTRESPKTCTIC